MASPTAAAASGQPNGGFSVPGQSQGPAIDRTGTPVVDPTANVLGLVEAAVNRLNDLREAEIRRMDDLRKVEHNNRRSESRHLREISELRATHAEDMREAEAKRIDAIRAVDVAAVQRAAEVSAAQAQTLATQVAVSAEALRGQVAAAAAAQSAALGAALDPINASIARLTQAQYEAQGQKQQVVESRGSAGDMQPILDALHALQAAQAQNVGGQQQQAAARDTNRFGLQLMGGLIGLILFGIAILQAIQVAKP